MGFNRTQIIKTIDYTRFNCNILLCGLSLMYQWEQELKLGKELKINVLGPVGDIVSEWILKGAFITSTNFGEYSWDSPDTAVNIQVTVAIDYAVLNF